jgi:hypothetical protein
VSLASLRELKGDPAVFPETNGGKADSSEESDSDTDAKSRSRKRRRIVEMEALTQWLDGLAELQDNEILLGM